MMADEKLFFSNAVQQLARCLAAIKPTPWEKVSTIFFGTIDRTTILQVSTDDCHFAFFLSIGITPQETSADILTYVVTLRTLHF